MGSVGLKMQFVVGPVERSFSFEHATPPRPALPFLCPMLTNPPLTSGTRFSVPNKRRELKPSGMIGNGNKNLVLYFQLFLTDGSEAFST